MQRPDDVFARTQEWNQLWHFVGLPGPAMQIALVRGPRRVGKSYLVRRLADVTGGFYFQADASEQGQCLRQLVEALARHRKVEPDSLPRDWPGILEELLKPGTSRGPHLVVLDEFPSLLRHSPELSELLVEQANRIRHETLGVRIMLCGAIPDDMIKARRPQRSLAETAVLDLHVEPFDYRTAARFWELQGSPRTAVLVDAVVGGVPAYRDFMGAKTPASPGELVRWLGAGVLNPANALFREDEYLLARDPSLTDIGLYHATLAAMAEGCTTQQSIGEVLGRTGTAVQYPLRSLVEAGFAIRADDLFRDRRPFYRIAQPIVRFHHAITRPDMALYEERQVGGSWNRIVERFQQLVLGPHLADIARAFVQRYATARTLGGHPTTVGAALVNNGPARDTHLLDVVAFGLGDPGAEPVLAVGDVRISRTPRGLGDLERLNRARAMVQSRRPGRDPRMFMFSYSGFSKDLVLLASVRGDLELVDIDRLYRGG